MNQWRKGIASWEIGKTLYISVPFTWLMKDAEDLASQYKGKVLIGGSGTMKSTECDVCEPLLFHNPLATFTTRGCPNSCSFCAVPKIEGEFREIKNFRPAPMICDNNLLESTKKHFEKVVDSLCAFSSCDFNQGLDARLFSAYHADQLTRLKKPHIRFSWDSIKTEIYVLDAISLCKQYGLKQISVYVLIGFNDTPEDAHYRLEKVRDWGAMPNPMRFQPLDAKEKNEYVHPAWTEKELRKTMKYYSRLAWLEHIPYEDFDYLQYDKRQQVLQL
jgi:hypothetical protein